MVAPWPVELVQAIMRRRARGLGVSDGRKPIACSLCEAVGRRNVPRREAGLASRHIAMAENRKDAAKQWRLLPSISVIWRLRSGQSLARR